MKYGIVATLIMILAIGSLIVAPMLQAEEANFNVTVTVIGDDGRPLENAQVTLYDSLGNAYTNKTDETGVTVITVPSNATYLVVVKGEYYILDTITVSGDMSYEVNASAMYYANITSEPVSADVILGLTSFEYVNITVTTNVKVYAPSEINVTFPTEIKKFPWRYVLENITYDNTETNESYVELDMAKDYDVKANYRQEFYLKLESWMLYLLVGLLVLAIVIAFFAGTRTARAVVEEWRARNSKFVRRK